MARRALGPAAQQAVAAVAASLSPDPGRPVLVAVSGGADSLALAAAAAELHRRRPFPSLRAVVVDHRLQPDSGQVAETARGQLAALGLAALVVPVTPGTGSGPEGAARTARLAALEEQAAADDALVLLGHTRDDQAETVLLGLARGSGTRSIAGMAAVRGRFRRPLLSVSRSITEQACQDWGLTFWRDPHNADPAYLRSRLRTELMPVLKEVLGDDADLALARTARLARADADLLDSLTPALPEVPAVDEIAALPEALRSRALLAWLRAGGLRPDLVHVVAVDALVTDWHGQGPLQLPGGSVTRRDGHLHRHRTPRIPPPAPDVEQ